MGFCFSLGIRIAPWLRELQCAIVRDCRFLVALMYLSAGPCYGVDRLEIKGYYVGMPFDEVATDLGAQASNCANTDDSRYVCFTRGWLLPEGKRTIAGENTDEWTFSFTARGGPLRMVWVTLDSSSAAKVLAAVKGKYGKPQEFESGAVSNKFGAKFPSVTARWKRGGSSIAVVSPWQTVDQMTVILANDADVAKHGEQSKKRRNADL